MNTDGNMLLRVMTRKSFIGFGDYKELRVGELLQLGKYKELIQMYYKLEKIDFDAEIKDELEIKFERVIAKPGKDYQKYNDNIYTMIQEIHDMNRTFHKDNPNRWNTLYEKKSARKRTIMGNVIRQNKEKSKIHNRDRNQKH